MSKVHHCMVDGVSGTDLISVLLDQARQGPGRRPGPTGAGAAALVGNAARANASANVLQSVRAGPCDGGATRLPAQTVAV